MLQEELVVLVKKAEQVVQVTQAEQVELELVVLVV